MEFLKVYEKTQRTLNVYINENQIISVRKANVSWTCEECGSPSNHNNYVLIGGHTCECGKIHPKQLCNESDLHCPHCGVQIVTYHTVDKSNGSGSNLGIRLQYDLHECKCNQCCNHRTINEECAHCSKVQIEPISCYNHYHCACGNENHVFIDQHYCRDCNEYGHWTQDCKNVKKITGIL